MNELEEKEEREGEGEGFLLQTNSQAGLIGAEKARRSTPRGERVFLLFVESRGFLGRKLIRTHSFCISCGMEQEQPSASAHFLPVSGRRGSNHRVQNESTEVMSSSCFLCADYHGKSQVALTAIS